VDTDLRASLVAGGSAATLSAIVGAIAGVSLLPLVLRALAGGLVFGAMFYGVIQLARGTLPGLENKDAKRGDSAYDEENAERDTDGAVPGRRVDIVLPGEGPDEEATAVEDEFPAERSNSVIRPALSSFEGESTAWVPAGATPSSDTLAASGESLLDDADLHEEAAVPFAATGSRDRGSGDAGAFDDLDVLPDLDGFSDSFAAPEYREVAGGEAAGSTRGTRIGSGKPTEGLDPVALAKAVRSILKRDQKG
jgi:hypothetical protein